MNFWDRLGAWVDRLAERFGPGAAAGKRPEPHPAWWSRALARAGVFISPGRRWRAQLQPRFFAVLAAGGLLGLLGVLGGAKYSESPRFCKSCHIMQPYYDAWSTSNHKGVKCVECHYPPGSKRTLLWKKFQALSQVAKYVTRTYSSKPFADVEDASCLKCHPTRLLEGWVRTSNGVKFDHRPHLLEKRRGRQLRCVSCHSQMVIGKHVQVTYDTCYLCHFKTGPTAGPETKDNCLRCHDIPKKEFLIGNMRYDHRDFVSKRGVACANCHFDAVVGQGEAPQDRCFTCHNQPEKLAKIGDVPGLHEQHVTKHNAACFHCHREIRHGFVKDEGSRMARLGEKEPERSTEAARGHPPTLRFDCAYCHEGKHAGTLEMYTGKAAPLGLPELPSPMYLAQVDCIGCHYKDDNGKGEFGGKTVRASEEACVKCHGPRFRGVWEETRKELRGSLGALSGKLAAARAAATAAAPAARESAQKELARADRLLDFVTRARGEHNIYLAAAALREGDAALERAGKELGAALPDVSGEPLLSGAFCATICHERVGVSVPPKTVRAFGKTMPHAQHAAMLGCAKCHLLGGHKRVPLRQELRKEVCATCHAQ